jgi:hypothetical protein
MADGLSKYDGMTLGEVKASAMRAATRARDLARTLKDPARRAGIFGAGLAGGMVSGVTTGIWPDGFKKIPVDGVLGTITGVTGILLDGAAADMIVGAGIGMSSPAVSRLVAKPVSEAKAKAKK